MLVPYTHEHSCCNAGSGLAMNVSGHAGPSMQLPLVPGIQVQVSMPPPGAHLALRHPHRLDCTQTHLEAALQLQQQAHDAADRHQQRGMHAEGQQDRQQRREDNTHTRLLKYSGQSACDLYIPYLLSCIVTLHDLRIGSNIFLILSSSPFCCTSTSKQKSPLMLLLLLLLLVLRFSSVIVTLPQGMCGTDMSNAQSKWLPIAGVDPLPAQSCRQASGKACSRQAPHGV